MTIASHAKGRGFNPLTAQDYKHELSSHSDERAFALIHGHLIDVASLPNRRGDEVFLCPYSPLPVDIKPAFSGAGSKRGQTPGESVQGGAK